MTNATDIPGSAADQPDLRDIQGNLIGFNKDHQRLVFLRFADQATGRAFLAELEPDLASGREVKRFNGLFKEIQVRRGGEPGIVESSWTNLALSSTGLQVLGAPGLETFPEEFRVGMAARSEVIGDKDDSAPSTWIPPFNQPQEVHAVAILAADSLDDLEACYQRLHAKLQAHQVSELAHQDGNVRPGPNRGREHFGFKDGISQPGIAGLTKSSKRGQDEIAAGEFLIGYPNQDGQVSGQPTPVPEPGSPGYNPTAPPPPPAPLPEWTKDGSFLVYRRLRQNVQAFNDFLSQKAAELGIDPELLGAKLVGRWKSGAPLEHTPDEADSVDPSAHDPSRDDTSLLTDRKINNFDYDQDADGHLVPRAAHIRKTNPRSEDPPGKEESNRHRILRRGIVYGPEFQPGEPPYPGAGPVPDNQDRGLLFVCYQASISRGFEFIQSQWANENEFPQPNDGRDPIISQDLDPRGFNLTPQGVHLELARWVATTGGEYFFAPSLPAIRTLAAGG
jgi:Dyp-type peroxidase family